MKTEFAFTTRGLTKHYGDRVAVDSLDLSVQPGRVTGFVGPNGAGKTTTIRMVLGLIRATAGRVEVLGKPVGRSPDFLRRVGALVDGPAFYPALSGRDNLQVLARLSQIGTARIDEALQVTGLTERAGDRVGSYSLGMRQRLGIAAAILPDPQLIILDEPTNGLDPSGVQDVRHLLRRLAEQGRTVFVSSHQLAELEHICDDLVLLRAGRLIYQGPMQDLLQRSASELTVRPENHCQLEELSKLVSDSGFANAISGEFLTITAPAGNAGSVNRLAAEHGITLVELRAQTPSLEEVFFGLTSDEDRDQ